MWVSREQRTPPKKVAKRGLFSFPLKHVCPFYVVCLWAKWIVRGLTYWLNSEALSLRFGEQSCSNTKRGWEEPSQLGSYAASPWCYYPRARTWESRSQTWCHPHPLNQNATSLSLSWTAAAMSITQHQLRHYTHLHHPTKNTSFTTPMLDSPTNSLPSNMLCNSLTLQTVQSSYHPSCHIEGINQSMPLMHEYPFVRAAAHFKNWLMIATSIELSC